MHAGYNCITTSSSHRRCDDQPTYYISTTRRRSRPDGVATLYVKRHSFQRKHRINIFSPIIVLHSTGDQASSSPPTIAGK